MTPTKKRTIKFPASISLSTVPRKPAVTLKRHLYLYPSNSPNPITLFLGDSCLNRDFARYLVVLYAGAQDGRRDEPYSPDDITHWGLTIETGELLTVYAVKGTEG